MSDDQTMRYDVDADAITGILVGIALSLPVWVVAFVIILWRLA